MPKTWSFITIQHPVVLGKAPYYLQKTQEIGGKAFQLSKELLSDIKGNWDKIMALNKAFLNKAIQKGYSFLLSNPFNVPEGSGFDEELKYMFKKGYNVIEKVIEGVTTHWLVK